MSEQPTTSQTAEEKLWLIVANGREAGPFPTSSVLSMLRRAEITPTTPACISTSRQWRPLNAWPEFAAACQSDATAPESIESPQRSGGWPLRVICAYCIVVAPLLCLLGVAALFLSRLSPPNTTLQYTFHLALLMSGWAIVLLTGGLKLHRRERAALPRIRFALYISIGFFVALGLSWLLALVFGGSGQASSTHPGCASCLVITLRLAFEIYTLVWLREHEGELFDDSSPET